MTDDPDDLDDPDDPDDPDASWKPKQTWEQPQRGRRPNRARGGRANNQVKRFRPDQEQLARQQQAAALQAIQQQPKERPDANHHLKFTYGQYEFT